MNAGNRLREMRQALGLSMRNVERASKQIAQIKGNAEYVMSSAWLTQIENQGGTPSIYKLYAMSVIYHVSFDEIVRLFDIEFARQAELQHAHPARNSHLSVASRIDDFRLIQFPLRMDPGFSARRTNLISRAVQEWAEIPLGFLRYLDLRHATYGYIGTNDLTMSPLLRPGTLVQIDTRRHRIETPPWKTEYDRPIYFIELREEYICSWCERHGDRLYVVPHPLSGQKIRAFAMPNEAEVLGRVVSISMRIVPMPVSETSSLPHSRPEPQPTNLLPS